MITASWLPRAQRAARTALDSVLPQLCPACGVPADPARLLCDACLDAIPRLDTPLCARCLSRGREGGACARHLAHRVWPAWIYEERATRVVHALKYEERPGLAEGLGGELARVVPARPRADLVIEVPLHAARLRERGYNQAERLALALASEVSVPWLAGVLERVRPTRPQARLDLAQRRLNVADAFRVRRPEWVWGRDVLVVDDVMTTGSTLSACLDALALAGARASGVVLAWAQ